MRRALWIFLLALALPCAGVQRTASKLQLRQLAKFPKIDLAPELTFNPPDGFSLLISAENAAEEITKIRIELTGRLSDAPHYLRLAQFYRLQNDRNRAMTAQRKALELFQKQLDFQPGNAELLASLGKAFLLGDKYSDAENRLREAVRAAPDQAEAWLGLGMTLVATAQARLLPGTALLTAPPFDQLARAAGKKVETDAVESASRLLTEALQCFDKAVELEPERDELKPYLERGLYRSHIAGLQWIIRAFRRQEIEPWTIRKVVFDPEITGDFEKAVAALPRNQTIIGTTLLFGAFSTLAQNQEFSLPELLEENWWERLPARRRDELKGHLARLVDLGEQNDEKKGAKAFETLAVVQYYLLRDRTGAEASARRALELDPSRTRASDILIAIVAAEDRPADLLALSLARLQWKDSVRNRLFLAKAYYSLNELNKAEQHLQVALGREANDFHTNLALAALLIRRDGENASRRIREALGRAQKTLTSSRQQIVDFTVTQSIFYGVTDNPELARRLLESVISLAPNKSEIEELLAVLGS